MACDRQDVLPSHKYNESLTFLKMAGEISVESMSVYRSFSLLPPNCRTGGSDFFFPVIYHLRR